MKQNLFRSFAALFLAVPSCYAKPQDAPPPQVRRVVLVHGFGENGSALKMMKNRLEKRGFECYVPKLDPCDGRGGLEKLALHLKVDIDDKFGPTEPISVVGFSMGGIVSRQYLQILGGARRCRNFVTISSPHHGTKTAWLYPSKGAEEMRSGSPFLKNLENTENRLGKMSVTSYRTPMDLMILPATNSIWDRAENVEFPVLMHPLMITSGPVLKDLEERLLK